MKVRDLLKAMARDGWVLKNQEGSHRQFVHPTNRVRPLLTVTLSTNFGGDAEVYIEAGGYEMSDSRYAVIFEKSGTGYGAYVPDLPGCIATGTTLELTRKRMSAAIAAHLRAMREDGDPVPAPSHVENAGCSVAGSHDLMVPI